MFPRGIAFDDVLLVPGYNGIRSRQAVTTSVQDYGRCRSRFRSFPRTWTRSRAGRWRRRWQSSAAWEFYHQFMSIEQNVAEYRRAQEFGRSAFRWACQAMRWSAPKRWFHGGVDSLRRCRAMATARWSAQTVRQLRDRFGDNVCIIAGNVANVCGRRLSFGSGR